MHLTVYSARQNLNITSVFICIMHVIMHACNMDVLAHGNYTSVLDTCMKFYTHRVAICVHVSTLSPCAAHTQRIATPCLSYKHFGVYVNKQCMMNKAYEQCIILQTTGNIGRIWAQAADSDSRAYLKETLTEQSFCVAMLCAAVSPRPSKWEVMPPSSRKVYGRAENTVMR